MKARWSQLATVIVAAATVWIAGDRSDGFSYFQSGGIDVVWPGAQSVRYLSPTTFPDGSDQQMLILGAMGLWNLVPASDFEYFYSLDGLDTIDPYDGYNDTIAADLDPGVLAVTFMVSLGASWYDMDQVYSASAAGAGWTFDPNPDCAVVSDPATYGCSFLLVATHELGHALGLGHCPFGDEPPGTPWFIATMNPAYPAGGPVGQENIVEVHTDDRNGTRYLYPHSGPSDPPVVDLANAMYASGTGAIGKAAPILFSPSAVDPGDVLTARSVLENFGTTNEFYVRQGFYLSTDNVIDTGDLLLGSLRWDLAFQDAFEFDVDIDIPQDLPAGPYHLGTILDDLNEVAEAYEDNNAAIYCEPLTVNQLIPAINTLDQQVVPCGVPYTGPTPTVTHPLNMSPITWSLDNPEPGMTVDPNTGVISWPAPVRSEFLYTVHLRATNGAGSATQTLFLGVTEAPPEIESIPDETASCGCPYTGPAPTITSPECMDPIINWSLDDAPAGMTVDHDTGVVSWPAPRPALAPYAITIRATNAAGNGTQTWQLTVTSGDMDGDGDVDPADYALVETCLNGPGGGLAAGCTCADADADGDVDLADFGRFQINHEGSSAQGACCYGDGTCSDDTQAACTAAGGSYLGDGTDCAASACVGACCFSNGFCWDFSQDVCNSAPDTTFQGFGTQCATTDCSAPMGSCCHPDQTCTEGAEADCTASGGTYQGDGTGCATSDCTTPDLGACCNPADWTCSETTETTCTAAGGAYEGDATTCSATSCPEYRNDADPVTAYYNPGAGSAMADDVTLAGTDRDLVYYDAAVYGGGSGPFDVSISLYTDCPGNGGTLIPGTSGTWTDIPDDDFVYILSADLSQAPVTAPDTVWMVATFSTAQAGWVLAEHAEVGFSADVFGQDDPPWGCAFAFGGASPPYSGFWADLQCIPAAGSRFAAGEIRPTMTRLYAGPATLDALDGSQ
ncbi:MAG: matrixin family metalloprotease [Phycisphaerales bacterium]|nr:MAG: matrixin family metalloprotease [Phycisphaerales bacterium]